MDGDAPEARVSEKKFLKTRKREFDRRLGAAREILKRSVERGLLSEEDADDIFTHSRVAWTFYYSQIATIDELRSARRKRPFRGAHGKP